MAPRRTWLTERRLAVGLSQEMLAELVEVRPNTIQNWESGRSAPVIGVRLKLAKSLRLPIEELNERLSTETVRRSSDEEYGDDVNRREFMFNSALLALGMPESIRQWFCSDGCPFLIEADVQSTAQACNDYLCTQDAARGGGALYELARAMLHKVQQWTEGRAGGPVGRALEVLCCDLEIWVGWLSYDAGKPFVAQRHLQDAIIHARVIDCPEVEIRAMTVLCLVLNKLGRYRQTIQCAEAALRIAGPSATPRLGAVLNQRAATAFAQLGQEAPFRQSTRRAHQHFERGPRDDDPSWLHFVTWPELVGLNGAALGVLGQSKQAEDAFRSIVEDPDPAFRRNVVYYKVQLAHAVAKQGDVRQASELGLELLPEVATLDSGRIDRHLRQLRHELDRFQGNNTLAQQFAEAFDERQR